MKLSGGRRSTLLGVIAASLAASALFAASASAVIVHLSNGRTYSYQPLRGTAVHYDAAFGNLDYNGGPVMPSNTNYLIFWSPTGSTAYPTGYMGGLSTYLKDLAHDSGGHQNVDSVATQYNDASGQFASYKSFFGGALLDTDAYPANTCPTGGGATNCLDDAQLQAELGKFIDAHHLARDLRHEYFLMLPPHVENCFDNNPSDPNGPYGGCSAGQPTNPAYCAYHGNSSASPVFVYANDPYVTGNFGCDDGNHPNNSPSDGALEGGFSHEHVESITDPIPNGSWTDLVNPSEIGDKCGSAMGTALGTAPDGALYNQVINGHFYWYQQEYSNQTSSCLQRFTLSGSEPVAKFTAATAGGKAMSFNASTSTGGVTEYSWQFNDAPGLSLSPFESTSPTASHTFPSSSVYDVGFTAYTSNGTSKGAGGLIAIGHNGFISGFSYSPASPVHASAVTFHGIGTVDAHAVFAYSWDFGDGKSGSGQSPSHTYGAAGTYAVRLAMVGPNGSSTVTVRILHVG